MGIPLSLSLEGYPWGLSPKPKRAVSPHFKEEYVKEPTLGKVDWTFTGLTSVRYLWVSLAILDNTSPHLPCLYLSIRISQTDFSTIEHHKQHTKPLAAHH